MAAVFKRTVPLAIIFFSKFAWAAETL